MGLPFKAYLLRKKNIFVGPINGRTANNFLREKKTCARIM